MPGAQHERISTPAANIGQLADATTMLRGDAGWVEVRIWFDQTEPPVGHLRRLAAPDPSSDGVTGPTQFSGWLGLLRALSDALGGRPEDIHREP
ncbi:MAG TPA: hypothetical protein VE442_01140 [Jatrophihabitans sp.]|jgi:hypothetical protein|nr:hypothetical protein [Jatrophihabitans sp.]